MENEDNNPLSGTAGDIGELADMREYLEFQSTLLNHISEKITVTDLNGTITFVNDSECRALGLSREELIGKSIEIFGADDSLGITQDQILQETLRTGSWQGRVQNRTADGRTVFMDVRTELLRGKHGQPLGIFGTSSDITENKRIETEGAKNEKLFRSIFELAATGIALADPDGRLLRVNRKFCRLTGYTPRELATMNFRELTCPEDIPSTDEQMDRVMRGEIDTYALEKRYIHKNGSMIWITLYLSVLRNADGQPEMFIAVVNDISEQKKAERDLAESERRYRTLFDNAPVGLISIDLDGTVIEANEKLALIIDAPSIEAIKRVNIFAFDREFSAGVSIAFKKCIETGLSGEHEYTYTSDSGQSMLLHYQIVPAKGCDGLICGAQASVQDITYRRETENALRTSYRELQDKQKETMKLTETLKKEVEEKELLLREIHHRVKNNLQIISSLLSLQSDTSTDPSATDVFADSRNRINAIALVHELLYETADIAMVDFQRYAEDLAKDMSYTYGASGTTDIIVDSENISFDIDHAIPCGLIIQELLSNAFKHAFPAGTRGTITILLRRDNDGKGCILTVSDNGAGIPEALDLEGLPSLGLRLVQALAGQLNGELKIQRDGGTKVTVHFPCPL